MEGDDADLLGLFQVAELSPSPTPAAAGTSSEANKEPAGPPPPSAGGRRKAASGGGSSGGRRRESKTAAATTVDVADLAAGVGRGGGDGGKGDGGPRTRKPPGGGRAVRPGNGSSRRPEKEQGGKMYRGKMNRRRQQREGRASGEQRQQHESLWGSPESPAQTESRTESLPKSSSQPKPKDRGGEPRPPQTSKHNAPWAQVKSRIERGSRDGAERVRRSIKRLSFDKGSRGIDLDDEEDEVEKRRRGRPKLERQLSKSMGHELGEDIGMGLMDDSSHSYGPKSGSVKPGGLKAVSSEHSLVKRDKKESRPKTDKPGGLRAVSSEHSLTKLNKAGSRPKSDKAAGSKAVSSEHSLTQRDERASRPKTDKPGSLKAVSSEHSLSKGRGRPRPDSTSDRPGGLKAVSSELSLTRTDKKSSRPRSDGPGGLKAVSSEHSLTKRDGRGGRPGLDRQLSRSLVQGTSSRMEDRGIIGSEHCISGESGRKGMKGAASANDLVDVNNKNGTWAVEGFPAAQPTLNSDGLLDLGGSEQNALVDISDKSGGPKAVSSKHSQTKRDERSRGSRPKLERQLSRSLGHATATMEGPAGENINIGGSEHCEQRRGMIEPMSTPNFVNLAIINNKIDTWVVDKSAPKKDDKMLDLGGSEHAAAEQRRDGFTKPASTQESGIGMVKNTSTLSSINDLVSFNNKNDAQDAEGPPTAANNDDNIEQSKGTANRTSTVTGMNTFVDNIDRWKEGEDSVWKSDDDNDFLGLFLTTSPEELGQRAVSENPNDCSGDSHHDAIHQECLPTPAPKERAEAKPSDGDRPSRPKSRGGLKRRSSSLDTSMRNLTAKRAGADGPTKDDSSAHSAGAPTHGGLGCDLVGLEEQVPTGAPNVGNESQASRGRDGHVRRLSSSLQQGTKEGISGEFESPGRTRRSMSMDSSRHGDCDTLVDEKIAPGVCEQNIGDDDLLLLFSETVGEQHTQAKSEVQDKVAPTQEERKNEVANSVAIDVDFWSKDNEQRKGTNISSEAEKKRQGNRANKDRGKGIYSLEEVERRFWTKDNANTRSLDQDASNRSGKSCVSNEESFWSKDNVNTRQRDQDLSSRSGESNVSSRRRKEGYCASKEIDISSMTDCLEASMRKRQGKVANVRRSEHHDLSNRSGDSSGDSAARAGRYSKRREGKSECIATSAPSKAITAGKRNSDFGTYKEFNVDEHDRAADNAESKADDKENKRLSRKKRQADIDATVATADDSKRSRDESPSEDQDDEEGALGSTKSSRLSCISGFRLSPKRLCVVCVFYCASVILVLVIGIMSGKSLADNDKDGEIETSSIGSGGENGGRVRPHKNDDGSLILPPTNGDDGQYTTTGDENFAAMESPSPPTSHPSHWPSSSSSESPSSSWIETQQSWQTSTPPTWTMQPSTPPTDTSHPTMTPPSSSPTPRPGCPQHLLKSAALGDDGMLWMKYEVVVFGDDSNHDGAGGLLCVTLEYKGESAWIGLAFSEASRDTEAIIGIPGLISTVAVSDDSSASMGQQFQHGDIEGGPAFVNPGKYTLPAGGVDDGYFGPSLSSINDIERQTLIDGSVTITDPFADGGIISDESTKITQLSFAKYLREANEIEISTSGSILLLHAVAPLGSDGEYGGNPEWKNTSLQLLGSSFPDLK